MTQMTHTDHRPLICAFCAFRGPESKIRAEGVRPILMTLRLRQGYGGQAAVVWE